MARMEDGNTLRDHLQAAERTRKGASRGFLKLPPIPDEMVMVWQWYCDLSGTRSYGGMGSPMPISHTEIWSWCQLNGIELASWQLRAIRLLDATQLGLISKKGEDVLQELIDGK